MTPTPTPSLADEKDPETGMTPREAAEKFLSFCPPEWREGDDAFTAEHALSNPIWCGQMIERVKMSSCKDWKRDMERMRCGLDPDDTLRNFYARRQDAATNLAESVTSLLDAVEYVHHDGDFQQWDAALERLRESKLAYDAAHAGGEGGTDAGK